MKFSLSLLLITLFCVSAAQAQSVTRVPGYNLTTDEYARVEKFAASKGRKVGTAYLWKVQPTKNETFTKNTHVQSLAKLKIKGRKFLATNANAQRLEALKLTIPKASRSHVIQARVISKKGGSK